MNKHDTEIEARKIIQLSEPAVRLLKVIGYNPVAGAELAKQLLDELIQCGAVAKDITYTEFVNNVTLKKAMLVMMACSLSDRPADSQLYGKGIVSHFDLFFNCNTNLKFNQFLASIKFVAKGNRALLDELVEGRDNITKFMRSMCNYTIENMELTGAPAKFEEVDDLYTYSIHYFECPN